MLLFLLGYMGSGKTTVGKSLAGKLGYFFSDLDDEIEKGEGMTIKDIFEKKGEQEFRKLERDYLMKYNATLNIVVAAGGGTPCHLNNMEWMQANGKTVYLKVPPETLFGRLRREKANRPLIKNLDDAEMKKFIHEKVSERELYYGQSDIIINCDGKNKGEIVNNIYLQVS